MHGFRQLYWQNRVRPVEIFCVLESWLVRTWGICYAFSASEGLFPAWHDSFFGAFISILDLLDMLRCGCTVFIPVSNGYFCALICKRYAVMEESLIKRIALSIEEKTWQQRMITCDRKWSFQFATVQIFVLLLLIIYSPDCIYLDVLAFAHMIAYGWIRCMALFRTFSLVFMYWALLPFIR